MLVELSLVPIGDGVSISGQLAQVMDLVDKSGLDYRVNAMGTVIEGDWDKVMALVKQCHQLMLKGTPRVITSLKIDDRTDKAPGRITRKVESVEEKLGRSLKK